MPQVSVHRVRRDVQPPRSLLVGRTEGHQVTDLESLGVSASHPERSVDRPAGPGMPRHGLA